MCEWMNKFNDDGSLKPAHQIVQEQADDESLWFINESIETAYIQQALTLLHSVVNMNHLQKSIEEGGLTSR